MSGGAGNESGLLFALASSSRASEKLASQDFGFNPARVAEQCRFSPSSQHPSMDQWICRHLIRLITTLERAILQNTKPTEKKTGIEKREEGKEALSTLSFRPLLVFFLSPLLRKKPKK